MMDPSEADLEIAQRSREGRVETAVSRQTKSRNYEKSEEQKNLD